MGKLHKVNRGYKERVLLTETLPYEVPILFSNEGFYTLIKSRKIDDYPQEFLSLLFPQETQGSEKPTHPYFYKIIKSATSFRKIGLPHPTAQYRFVGFYENYHAIITALCSRSRYSLRAPSSVASHYTDKLSTTNVVGIFKEDDVESEQQNKDGDQKHASSYFLYKDFALLYKFFDSFNFHRLERKYSFMLRFDISKCFSSIYTHSITWAVKDKQFVKDNLTKIKVTSFEGVFDRYMQVSNSSETNGIIIGPEFSRIFAEVILQRVDQNVRQRATEENLLNFSVKRYVDDYFVFTNNEELAHKIMAIFREELEKFNLHLNESKIIESTRPFITHESVAKQEALSLIRGFFERYVCFDLEESLGCDPVDVSLINSGISLRNSSLDLIAGYKAIAKRNSIGYEATTNLFLTNIRNNLAQMAKSKHFKANERDDGRLSVFIEAIITVSFYVFSMDSRYRPSYLIFQIIMIILTITKRLDGDKEEGIKKAISDEIVMTLRHDKGNSKGIPQELLNFLILHRELGERHLLSEDFLYRIFGLKHGQIKEEEVDYFTIMVILYYISNDKQYNALRIGIEKLILSKIDSQNEPLTHAELFMLFVDSISCPFVSEKTKNRLLNIYAKKHLNCKSVEKDSCIKQLKSRLLIDMWFFNWDKEKAVHYLLMKKELKMPSLNMSY